mmetsp:Transcript_536/g.1168  ORF Transcript_536/g.1168 Transcript_536/m.1168 type:complete len:241 (-) Transcript_536:455-1177(-)
MPTGPKCERHASSVPLHAPCTLDQLGSVHRSHEHWGNSCKARHLPECIRVATFQPNSGTLHPQGTTQAVSAAGRNLATCTKKSSSFTRSSTHFLVRIMNSSFGMEASGVVTPGGGGAEDIIIIGGSEDDDATGGAADDVINMMGASGTVGAAEAACLACLASALAFSFASATSSSSVRTASDLKLCCSNFSIRKAMALCEQCFLCSTMSSVVSWHVVTCLSSFTIVSQRSLASSTSRTPS